VEQLQAQGVKSIAVMPLETRGETFGAIIAIFHEERLFAPEERRFLLTLADQTSVALDAVMLFQSTQETLRSISRMYQASRAIAGQSDIDEALQIIREQVMLLEPDRVDISLARDQDGQGMLVSVMDWSSDDDYTPLSLLGDQDNLFDFLSYDDIFIDDLAKAQDHILLSVYADLPYQAIASLPFRAAGQPTGRLTIAFRRKRAFSTDEKQFLQMIADSTAYVIENDILFKQTQDSLEETGILYQAIRAFANAEDKEGILQAIIDYAADPAVDKALLCLLLTEDWYSPNALMEVVVSWVRGDSVDLTGMRFTSEQFPSWEQIATTEILWVDDVMTTPTLDDTARMGYRALDVGSFAIVPLIMSNKPIGAILLGSSEPRLHREREIRIYQSLADQAAITMENIRLFAESERRARQLGTSAQVSRAASSILTVDTLLPQIVDLIKEAFGYDHVQVFLLNKEGDKAMLHASTGEAGQQLLAIHHYLEVGSRSVIGQVTATGKPSIALDTADARVTHKPNPYLPNTRSEMALPLIANDRILGALDVQSNQPGAFTDNDVRVLTILSDQLAVAIQNASLFELSRRRNEEMSFLFEVASQATTLGEIDKTLQAVAHLILQQTGASLVAIYLHDEAAAALQLNAITLADPLPMGEILQRTELSSDDALAQVASNRLPIIISDYGYSDYYSTRPPQIQSGIYVPMVTGDRLIGVLSVESMELNDFDDSTLNLLQTLSSSLAAVIQSKQLLEEIQTANERLREIDKLKTNFLAAMSHELRTPLNSIIGFSRVILKGIDGPVTETQKQDLQTIHDSGKHLLGLVNDILDQAKIESNKMELARAYFDLRPVINGVMASAVGLTKEKPIQLLKEVQDDLPNAFGDEFRTRQILLNLVSNAAKFTEEGSITTSVYVVEKEGIKYLKASVTDTGIGIRPEDFDKMFESFQQVDNSTTRAAEGTGLGLPLARSLARLQGGDVEVESEYGVGSTFSVLIPTQPTAKQLADMAAKEQGGPDEPSPAPSNGNTPPAPKSILILDDNVDMMNFYRRHLSKEGYTIIGVTTLKDAYDKLATVNPAAILLNVDMDNGQGWAYMADLKQLPLPRPIPIIVNSLSSDPGQSQEQGAAFHLARPFEPEVLLEALGKIG
jgi:GAF domain-containing protein/anti-sigma regulatory factor (Ser/Thr protein kinase)